MAKCDLLGLAPYVADYTALFRTDWHPAGHAWMMRAETLQDAAGRWGDVFVDFPFAYLKWGPQDSQGATEISG